jgi:hypothetical protein
MQSINALSLAGEVNNCLETSHSLRILHVFDQTCNLINEHNEVLAIVTPEIGNGPFNLVVEDDVLFSEHLKAESPIYASANQISLGDLTIHVRNARLWNPRPDWGMLHTKRIELTNQIPSLPVAAYQPSLSPTLLSTFSLSMAIRDFPSSIATAKKLAGLGQGLTPAGDDFIMGAIYAAWIIHPADIARVLTEEIANTAAPLTTSLSAAWLRSAGKGEAGILWHEFFDALSVSDNARTHQAVDKILAVGETSGADALAGFIGSFIAWIEWAGISHG